MNMHSSSHRAQAAVRDPEWYTRSATRLKPGSPSTDTTVIDDMGGSLASLNLDSINFDFDNLENHHHVFGARSMPAIMATDAPWNESPRSLRSHAPASARRIAATMCVPPPGVSPLDHLQNSLSNISMNASRNFNSNGPPINIIAEDYDEEQDMTDLDNSLASLAIEHLQPRPAQQQYHQQQQQQQRAQPPRSPGGQQQPSPADMDATAHAGNVTRGNSRGRSNSNNNNHNNSYAYGTSSRTSSSSYSTPAVNVTAYHSSFVKSNNSFYQSNPTGDDEEDNDDVEIIKMLRRQVQTLKVQLADEQAKNLRANNNNSVSVSNMMHQSYSNSFQSVESSTTCSSGFGNDDSGSVGTSGSVETAPTSNNNHLSSRHLSSNNNNNNNNIFNESMQAIQLTVHALEKPITTDNEDDKKILLEDLQTHVLKLETDQEKLLREYTAVTNENKKLHKKVDQQAKKINQLEEQLLLCTNQQ